MKGNALIGQSGGPTAVINASLSALIRECRAAQEIGRTLGMRFGIEGFLNEQIVDLDREQESVVTGLKHLPSSALGSCRYKLSDKDLPKVRALLEKYGIRWLFLIGGNDTMDTIHRIEAFCRGNGYELRGIGVPKTVDNDLYGTDHSPGYGSAGRYTALSVQQAGCLARDMQKVDRYVIYQTVGREAGWLAASAALAKKEEDDAPHLIYVPERPINRERFLSDTEKAVKTYGWVSIVCGEGIVWEDGSPVSGADSQDKFSNVEFGAMGGRSAAMNLHQLLKEETGYRGEFQVTESLSMCAADRVSETDREEAFRCGEEAVRLACAGESGKMVSIKRVSSDPYEVDYGSSPLSETAVRAKPLEDGFISKKGNFVSPSFYLYARPLIGALPEYTRPAYHRYSS